MVNVVQGKCSGCTASRSFGYQSSKAEFCSRRRLDGMLDLSRGEALSSAGGSRLAALPDLSYMLSQRICFPMRTASPMPVAPAATMGEALL
ncbi:unnamed protein product [Scytosiphon promiscuus]